MRVLSVDPGYDRVGIAVLERVKDKETLLHSDCFVTKRFDEFSNRLISIGEEVERVIMIYKPEALALEKLFFTNNQKTAMGVAEVRGMLMYIGKKAKLSLFEYTPLQVKQGVTGSGASDKIQVSDMVTRLLKLPAKKRRDDEYDAIALGLTCLASARLQGVEKNGI